MDPLDDAYVATLLKNEAANRSTAYSQRGLQALLPPRAGAKPPKPNTRFLRNIVRDADTHNAALLAREAEESRQRLKRLQRKQDGRLDSPTPPPSPARKPEKQPSDRRRHRDSRRRSRSPRDHHRDSSRRRHSRRSTSPDHHRRRRRSRSPTHRKRRRSPSRDRDPVKHPRRRHRTPSPPRDPTPSPGPSAPSPAPRTRGRGAPGRSAIDAHFTPSYDPSTDVPTASSPTSASSLSAFRERKKWEQAGAARLRAAGFSEEYVSLWERNRLEDAARLQWTARGGTREWDRGKVVEAGEVRSRAAWARPGT